MSDAARAQQKAITTRAAVAEAERQAARQRGDTVAERALEAELRNLWRAFADAERVA